MNIVPIPWFIPPVDTNEEMWKHITLDSLPWTYQKRIVEACWLTWAPSDIKLRRTEGHEHIAQPRSWNEDNCYVYELIEENTDEIKVLFISTWWKGPSAKAIENYTNEVIWTSIENHTWYTAPKEWYISIDSIWYEYFENHGLGNDFNQLVEETKDTNLNDFMGLVKTKYKKLYYQYIYEAINRWCDIQMYWVNAESWYNWSRTNLWITAWKVVRENRWVVKEYFNANSIKSWEDLTDWLVEQIESWYLTAILLNNWKDITEIEQNNWEETTRISQKNTGAHEIGHGAYGFIHSLYWLMRPWSTVSDINTHKENTWSYFDSNQDKEIFNTEEASWKIVLVDDGNIRLEVDSHEIEQLQTELDNLRVWSTHRIDANTFFSAFDCDWNNITENWFTNIEVMEWPWVISQVAWWTFEITSKDMWEWVLSIKYSTPNWEENLTQNTLEVPYNFSWTTSIENIEKEGANELKIYPTITNSTNNTITIEWDFPNNATVDIVSINWVVIESNVPINSSYNVGNLPGWRYTANYLGDDWKIISKRFFRMNTR